MEPTNNTTGTTTEQQPVGNVVNSANNWKSDIAPDYHEHINHFESIGDLVKGYYDLKSKPQGLIPPQDDNQEQWNSFYNQLGRPENKQYLEANDEERKTIAPYEDILFNAGLSKKQGQTLLNALINKAQTDAKANEEAQKKTYEANQAALKEKYGDKMDATLNVINSTLKKFGGESLTGLLEATQYHPELVNFLVNVGQSQSPSTLITGDSKPITGSKEHAIAEIKRLENDDKFMQKYHDNSHQDHDEAIKTLTQLYDQAYSR
ncbi:hypothetical protein [Cysteiniphilum sp. 6C5]|uniref:hypothetical protein n=1 Tax=unclassified Cysteiniphilum TaxID=2610889 RepID=UPI003F83B693